MINHLKMILIAALVATAAASNAADDAAASKPYVLLELFTSQGCYSCPPAEKLVHEKYSKRDDVIALEFHVDYWDDLVYGSAGVWADPFSNADYTRRQQFYNKKIRNTRTVFTPQMIINGIHQSSGANEGVINGFIQKEHEHAQQAAPVDVSFAFEPYDDGGWKVKLNGTINGNESLYYAIYQKEATTEIPSGENKGKTLTSSNIVLSLSAVSASRRAMSIPPIRDGEGCAVWVQKSYWKVIHAAPCPTSGGESV